MLRQLVKSPGSTNGTSFLDPAKNRTSEVAVIWARFVKGVRRIDGEQGIATWRATRQRIEHRSLVRTNGE